MNGVIFDFNGTLFLDNDKHIKAWNKIAMELRGTGITEEELHSKMNGVNNKYIIRYLNSGKEDDELEAKYSTLKEQYYRRFCKEDTKNFHLIEGAVQLFDQLKQKNIPFTIASASIKDNIDFFVENFQLDRWIDPETIVYDNGQYKDKEAMFLQAARNIHVPVDQICVIEDSLAGVNASIKAGIPDIRIIDSGHIASQVESLEQVRQICDTMKEIEL
ncbi:HAD family phosphatase [uncultured Dubosiella sp.]|uniref:HAD family hydrolase n=1 Tax=uncultured Dubosiella sp. TaxID=1937011 RepID=UPI00273190A0|nr:HAD family phosphatase [uncultured Dubosiella sp.]